MDQKMQSAVEYLTTYAWALVVIAVVSAVLFYLGIFNPYAIAAKAQPGGCLISRPEGPNTTAYISYRGVCSNLIPEYVAQFSGQGYISGPDPSIQTAVSTYDTVSFWMYWTGNSGEVTWAEGSGSDADKYELAFPSSDSCFGLSTGNGDLYGINSLPIANKWVFVTAVMNNGGSYAGNFLLYINGAKQTLTQCSGSSQTGDSYSPFNISYQGNYFEGKIANVQLYNISLTSNAVSQLYYEGIGGVPVDLQHIIGWWPLDGNADDYSGNGDNGTTTGVAYSGTWYSTYTAP